MVIAVVGLDRGASISLAKRGVCDSKGFGAGVAAREKRAELATIVKERAPLFSVRVVPVEEVDRYTYKGLLNALEREVVHDLLVELGATEDDRIVCDGANMFAPLRTFFPQLEAVNRGESEHVAVAAASILAKDARDKAFAEIAGRYEGEFGPLRGGGYLNAATRAFLDAYQEKHGGLPPEARKSWGADKTAEAQVGLFE
jgi:ribonuclease HII